MNDHNTHDRQRRKRRDDSSGPKRGPPSITRTGRGGYARAADERLSNGECRFVVIVFGVTTAERFIQDFTRTQPAERGFGGNPPRGRHGRRPRRKAAGGMDALPAAGAGRSVTRQLRELLERHSKQDGPANQ